MFYITQIVGNWERSGNGYGQRKEGDKQFGHFDLEQQDEEDGDNRASYIQHHQGHRNHHLYLWYLGDKMGVLSNVLNILSPAVGADNNNVHTDTARVQNRRKSRTGEEDTKEREHKKKFRNIMSASMSYIAITEKEESIRREQDLTVQYKLKQYDLSPMSEMNDYLERLIKQHEANVVQYRKELNTMKAAVDGRPQEDDNNAGEEEPEDEDTE